MVDISEKVRTQFVGRRDALDAFYLRFASKHMKNGIYYCGDGGLGKTWILQKIIDENQNDPIRVVTPIIDFYDTQNHSVRGIQSAIRSRLPNPEVFRPYDEAINRLEEIRSKSDTHPSTIASLEELANKTFIECSQASIVGKEVILLFDTFERVQQRYVGRWLCQEFLHKVGDLIVAIAGRPEPTQAKMPDNIVTYKLGGIALEEFAELVRSRLPSAPDEIVESIWKHTGGAPLMTHLILDLREPDRGEFVARLKQLPEEKRIQDLPDLQRWLIGRYANPSDTRSPRNRVRWAMAFLRRRFDFRLLEYIVKNGERWFLPGDYETIYNELAEDRYVKEYPSQQSHLFHDEIQRMVAKYVLPDVGIWEEFREFLYDLVVNRYYSETPADLDLARRFRAEQLGYILDAFPAKGLEMYRSYRAEVERETHDYDFEELLWGEVREHLEKFENRGYDICEERGQWLRKHSLFEKAEELYEQMLEHFKERRVEISQSVGFMAMRQGNIPKAKEMFEQGLVWVKEGDWKTIAEIEGNLAQAAIEAGEWDKALDHYAQSFRAASRADDQSQMAAVYLSRGYLYSMRGNYIDAEKQCKLAIGTLRVLPDNPTNSLLTIYAWMNLGTVSRHTGKYDEAKSNYEKSLGSARRIGHRETESDCLQHLGINEHLWGRTLRRRDEKLAEACEHQIHAWQYIVDSLEIVRVTDWRKAIASGLHRLAKIYREIHRLQQLPQHATPGFSNRMQTLQQQAQTFHNPFEIGFESEMLMPGSFSEMNWLEKSARLFEVCALIADQTSDYHRELDGLTELARVFLEIQRFDLVPHVIRRIERIKAYDYEEELFAQTSQIIVGDWHFEQGRYDQALEQYKIYYARLAKLGGYPSYRLNDNLRNLEWRFSVLPRELVLVWCDALEDAWLEQSVSTVRPDMIDMLERIRLDALKRYSGSE